MIILNDKKLDANIKKTLEKLSKKCKRCNCEIFTFYELNNDEIIIQCENCHTYYFIPYD